MKLKTFLIVSGLLLSAIILNSCDDPEPYQDPVTACFAFPVKTYKIGETVNFTNCSQYAYSYKWSFGDGSISQDKHVQHAFTEAGTYTVVMTAYGETETAQDMQQVVVEASTDLDLLVMYYLTDDPVSNCDVTLYLTENDWYNFTNPLITGTTDLNGSVIFSDLNPIVYYLDAFKDDDTSDDLFYSNEKLGNVTDALIQDEVNYYNLYVELLQSESNRKYAVIKKIEKTTANDKYRQKYRQGKAVNAVY